MNGFAGVELEDNEEDEEEWPKSFSFFVNPGSNKFSGSPDLSGLSTFSMRSHQIDVNNNDF